MKYNGLEVVRGSDVQDSFVLDIGHPISGAFYNDLDLEMGDAEVFRVEEVDNEQNIGINYRSFDNKIVVWPEGEVAAMAVRYLREPTKEEGKGRIPIFNIPAFADFIYPHTYGPVAMSKSGGFEMLEPDGFHPVQQDRRLDGGLRSFHPSGDIYAVGEIENVSSDTMIGRIEAGTNDYKWQYGFGRSSYIFYNREHDYLIGHGGNDLLGYPTVLEANHRYYEANPEFNISLDADLSSNLCVGFEGENKYLDVGDGDPCVLYISVSSSPANSTIRSEVTYTNEVAVVTFGASEAGNTNPGTRAYRITDGNKISSIRLDRNTDNWQGLRGGVGKNILIRNIPDNTIGWLNVDNMIYEKFTDYSGVDAVTTLPDKEAVVFENGSMKIYNENGVVINQTNMANKPEVEGEPVPVEGRSVENPDGWGLL